MLLPESFRPFVEEAPCAVAARMVLMFLLNDEILRTLWAKNAITQYEQEITLTNLVDVTLDVACGSRRSIRAAYLPRKEEIAASLTAFYGKLSRTELGISEAVVTYTGKQAGQLIRAMGGLQQEPVPGFPTYVVDGNALTSTDHRLKPLRQTLAGALPGKSLAVYEHATGVVTQVVLCEDAYTQERAMLPDLEIRPGTHWIADRNFCVTGFFLRIQKADAFFTIRHHLKMTLNPEEKAISRGSCDTGKISEQTIKVTDKTEENEQVFFWRKITLKLDVPTRDGEKQIVLISNLPAEVHAKTIVAAYRQRWKIEQHFQRLTDWLHCEIPTLSHPRAALFAFSMSLVAANALAVLIAAIRVAHGEEAADNLSYMALADEVGGTYRGMMIALPPRRWTFVRRYSTKQFARVLWEIASHANLQILTKTRRGPKKPRPKLPYTKKHVSTHRLLNEAREKAC